MFIIIFLSYLFYKLIYSLKYISTYYKENNPLLSMPIKKLLFATLSFSLIVTYISKVCIQNNCKYYFK